MLKYYIQEKVVEIEDSNEGLLYLTMELHSAQKQTYMGPSYLALKP